MYMACEGGVSRWADVWNGPGGSSTDMGPAAATSCWTYYRAFHSFHGRSRPARWQDCNHGKRHDSLLWHVIVLEEQIRSVDFNLWVLSVTLLPVYEHICIGFLSRHTALRLRCNNSSCMPESFNDGWTDTYKTEIVLKTKRMLWSC